MTTSPVALTPSSTPRADLGGALLVRRRLLVAAMLLAAATVVIGHALNVPATLETGPFVDKVAAQPRLFLFGGLLQAASAFLLIPSAVGIMALVRARGAACGDRRHRPGRDRSRGHRQRARHDHDGDGDARRRRPRRRCSRVRRGVDQPDRRPALPPCARHAGGPPAAGHRPARRAEPCQGDAVVLLVGAARPGWRPAAAEPAPWGTFPCRRTVLLAVRLWTTKDAVTS